MIEKIERAQHSSPSADPATRSTERRPGRRSPFAELASLAGSFVLLLPSVLGPWWASPAVAEPLPQGPEFQVTSFTTGVQALPAVAVAADGSFVVAWESDGQAEAGYGTFLRRFDASGEPLGDDQQVNTVTAGDQWDADIGVFADGGFVVVWDDDSGADGDARGVFGRLFDANGVAQGIEFQLSASGTGDHNDPVVATAPDGGFLVAWEIERAGSGLAEDLEYRLFDSDGMAVSGDVPLNTNQADDQEDLDLAADADGNFVAVWESFGQDGSFDTIIARRIDSAGVLASAEIQVNVSTEGNQQNPGVAMGGDGRFLVVWEDEVQNPMATSVYGRFFGADGVAITGELSISTGGAAAADPRAAIDGEGHGIVVWEGLGQDGSGTAIVTSTVDASGMVVQAEQVVNTDTLGDQIRPQVAANEAGASVVVWMNLTEIDGSATAVRGRRFSESFFADGFESGNTSGWSSSTP